MAIKIPFTISPSKPKTKKKLTEDQVSRLHSAGYQTIGPVTVPEKSDQPSIFNRIKGLFHKEEPEITQRIRRQQEAWEKTRGVGEIRIPFRKEATFKSPGIAPDQMAVINIVARLPELAHKIVIGATNFFRKNINTLIKGEPAQTKQFESFLGIDIEAVGLDPDEMMDDTIEKGMKQFEIEKKNNPKRSDYLNAAMASAKTVVPDVLDVLIATNIAKTTGTFIIRQSARTLPDNLLFKIQQRKVNPNAIIDSLTGKTPTASPRDIKIAKDFINSLTSKERGELWRVARSYQRAGLQQVPLAGKAKPTILGKISGKSVPISTKIPPKISGLLPSGTSRAGQAGFINPEAISKDIAALAKKATSITSFKKVLTKDQLVMLAARGITPEVFFSSVKTPIPKELEPLAEEAIKNTPGAKFSSEGIELDISRYQKPEQFGEVSIRTGVFYLPEIKSPYGKYYSTGKYGYGGGEKIVGRTTLQNPIIVRAGTGGIGVKRAYDQIVGKGAYEKMRSDVLENAWTKDFDRKPDSDSIIVLLEKYGGDATLVDDIIAYSKEGNLLPYAIQEYIAAHIIRDAGYDAVLSYSKAAGKPRLSEVFDVRALTYPTEGMKFEYPEFYTKVTKGVVKAIPKEVEPLAVEARKYKSVDEFVNFIEENIVSRKIEVPIGIKGLTEVEKIQNIINKHFIKESKEISIEEARVVFERAKREGKSWAKDRSFDNPVVQLEAINRATPAGIDVGIGLNKSQLTDFYNQAKGVKEVKPKAVKPVKEVKPEEVKLEAKPTILPEELKKSNELIKSIHITVKEKGLTKQAFSDIKMKYGGARHLVGLRDRMSPSQLEDVLAVVKKARPVRIGPRTVISRKTESKIQHLYETLQKEGSMTPNHYEEILRKEGVIYHKTGQVREPRYISANNYITESKGKEIIERMINESYIIKQTESLSSAIRNDPKLTKVMGNIEKRISAEMAKKIKDPHSLESMRYYMQKAEMITGEPIFTIYQDLIDSHLENAKKRDLINKRLKESTPLFKKITSDEKSLQRVSEYIASKSNLSERPDKPEDITPGEVKLAKEIEKILKEYEDKVRMAKFLNYYYYNKPIADFDNYRQEIKEAVDIYESQGMTGLKEYIKTQEWGIIKSGYEPLQVAFPKIKLYKVGPTAVGKGHISIRLDTKYNAQDKNILQRLSSYTKQMDTLSELQPKIKALVSLFDDKWDKFSDPKKIKGEVEQFIQELKGYGMGGGFFEKILSRIYSQAMKTIIMPSPVLAARNLLQNIAFAPDRSILTDPRNKKLTAEDIEYIETYTLQTKPMIEDWFLGGEKPLPGLGFLTKLVDKVKLYPYSDIGNRYWGFWAKKNAVDRALKSKTTEGMMKLSTFEDMTLLEQKMALGILARDGEDAMSRYIARAYTDRVHFLYERAQRSPAEMGKMGRVMGNLMLFPRAYWELLAKNFFKMTSKATPFKVRFRALKVIFSVIAGGIAVGEIYREVTGRRDNPYHPLGLLAYAPGGLMVGTITQSGDVYRNIIMATSGDNDALARLTTDIPALADMWIPFYSYVLRGFEATTDMKNVDRLALRKLREIIDEEYKVRGGAYELERKAFEKWQYFIGGAGIDTQIKERIAEEKEEPESQGIRFNFKEPEGEPKTPGIRFKFE